MSNSKSMWRRLMATTLVLVAAMLVTAGQAAADDVPFDFVPGSTSFTQTGGGANVNGGHPDLGFGFKLQVDESTTSKRPPQAPRTSTVTLPAGLVGDPTSLEVCEMAAVMSTEKAAGMGNCPRESAAGVIALDAAYPYTGILPAPTRRLWRVQEGPSEAAAFASSINTIPVRIGVTVKPSTGYRVRATADQLPQAAIVREFKVTMWGVPADRQGDGPECDAYTINVTTTRCMDNKPIGDPTVNPLLRFGEPLEGAYREPLISNSSVCGSELVANLHLVPYGTVFEPISDDLSAGTLSGCEEQTFDPSIEVKPINRNAGKPSGFSVAINVPQSDFAETVSTAHVKDVSVTLPEGVAISPASADGLGACSDADLDLNGDGDPKCPDSSKLGTLKIETPVMDHSIAGAAYLGSQLSNDPESGEMYRLFLVAKTNGVLIKLKGSVRADADTGRLTATFKDNPQLPFSRMELLLDDSSRASLVNPKACGTYTAAATLTSWAGHSRDLESSFEVDRGCPGGKFQPTFEAGSTNPLAGASSDFALMGARQDDDKEVGTIRSIKLPEGLLGRVGSVALCDAGQAAAGSCPAESRIGSVQVAAGAGATPLWVPQAGKAPTSVSLAGPYRGAPYSLSIVVPAQAGPFDLGKVVVRSALHVDERTAQLSTGVDEARIYTPDGALVQVIEGAMPSILGGVPLNLRELRVIVDRDDFVVNPTNCSPMQITAQAVAVDGQAANLASSFTAANCATLGFAPRFSARILDKGRRSTLRSFHPRTRFVVAPRKGDANIGGARVVLPSSTLLDQANIGTTCTRAQMAERNCPEASIVGYAKAWSPLLRKAVEGPVYLAANGGVRPLPDLAAVLDGEIRVVLQGEIATQRGGGKARLQNTFRVVPDAPVSRFVLTMRGGAKRGLLVNSTDLCRSKERGVAVFHGQNGRTHRLRPRIATAFRGCAKARRQIARRSAARKAAARAAQVAIRRAG